MLFVKVPEISLPRMVPEPVPRIQESQGRPLFTFSSETASLIKFLTVSTALPVDEHSGENIEVPSHTVSGLSSCDSEVSVSSRLSQDCEICGHISVNQTSVLSGTDKSVLNSLDMMSSSLSDSGAENCPKLTTEIARNVDCMEFEESSKCVFITDRHLDSIPVQGCGHCRRNSGDNSAHKLCKNSSGLEINDQQLECECSGVEVEMKDNIGAVGRDILELDSGDVHRSAENHHVIKSVPRVLDANPQSQDLDDESLRMQSRLKNLIFVTGEFAVALHQLGFKNIPPSRESALSRGAAPFDLGNMDAYNMVVNYSNNDIHIVQRQQEPDKPDHLIDLYGHVTGLCLTPDQRFVQITLTSISLLM